MKFLVTIALLALAVAEAHHTPQHTLHGPRFQTGKLYKYDVEFNVTSGILGLSSQVSKVALKAEASIYAKTERDHILKIENVYTSDSLKAVDSKLGYIPLHRDSELEDRLSVPIKFTLENGEVTSYTLSPRDNMESKKIKKSILRSLEMHIPENKINMMETEIEMNIPVTYNVTKDTDSGMHTSHYMITVSPYTEFPAYTDVYNISRSDDFEAERYPAYHFHHNFRMQGCPEVCMKNWTTNEYGAGCPIGYEPHQSPIKMSFNQQHHLTLTDNVMTPEIIKTVESHVAQMYDQDMEVLLMYQLRRKMVSTGTITEPSGQQSYSDLKDMESEINEKEINELCQYKSSDESVETAKNLLREISKIVVKGDLEDKESTIIGQKIILLKNALKMLPVSNLERIGEVFIKKPLQLSSDVEGIEKVKRQIWLDILPLIGTEESVTYITKYIMNNINGDGILIWEAKEMLEALPENIKKPSERNIKELRTLMTESIEKIRHNHLIHSAVHLTLARVIGDICGNTVVVRTEPMQKTSWFSYRKTLRSLENSLSSEYEPVKCPEGLVKEIVQEISEKLMRSKKKEDIAVYLEALAHIGVPEVLPVITKYTYGVAVNLQEFSPKYIDFVKTVSLFALHNVAGKHPEEVLHIVLPMYFNETESPKVRNAAFGVLIRCQPSLEILQHVAIRSWSEHSLEVGSYVTSTLETFGNSTLPCMQPTSYRIKKIMPQLKRFDIGIHHSKNILWSYFDELRGFGLEGRYEHTPSNESIIPTTLYKSISYSTDSLRDVLMQMALNIEGLTQEKIVKKIEDFLRIRPMPTFDTRREREIFEEAILHPRVSEALRFTVYKRLFYTSSYNYFDEESSTIRSLECIVEYIKTYLKVSSAEYDGYLVKLFLPSSFHTVAIAKTLPYPVEFEMAQPLVVAVKVKSMERSPTIRNFRFQIRPSVYYTKLYTNQLKNIGDCKEVGVYHEHKLAMSYPFEIKYKGINFPNVTIKYKLPELRKQIFTYFSEAGTYAGKKELEILPSTSQRVPIKTQPTPFKIEKSVNLVGVPPLHFEIHTEDIGLFTEKLPQNPMEALDIAVRRVLNAGWRHKSMNVTLPENYRLWPRDTEVTLSIQYYREHVAKYLHRLHSPDRYMSEPEESSWNNQWNTDKFQRSPNAHQWNTENSEMSWFWRKSENEDTWSRDLKPADILTNKNPEVFIGQGRWAAMKLITNPHIRHMMKVEISTKPIHTSAVWTMEYNHTYCKTAHAMHIAAAVKPSSEPHPYELTLDHVMVFLNKPNVFKYDTHKEKQIATFITALGLPQGSTYNPWEKIVAVSKGKLGYQSLEQLLKDELLTRVDLKYFLPETHEQCLKDIRSGQALSVDCVKAIRERSLYNQLYMAILWKEKLPEVLMSISRRVDIYTKHFLFHHLNMTDMHNHPRSILINMNYIDKFVDEPVFDVLIRKPNETIEYKRVPTKGFQPLSSVYNLVQSSVMEVTNNSYPPICVMMEKYIKTYDMKSYHFSPEGCNYVLSSHCAERKYFAITAKGLDKSRGTKEIHIYVGDNTLILTPKSGDEWKVDFNGKEYIIKEAELLDKTQDIYVYTDDTDDETLLQVIARRAGISVLYDGINVKIQVDPRYKGEMCGLCSEFDGEELREYRGLDRCLYSHPIDFINSAITNRHGMCDKRRLFGEKMCDDEENTMLWTRKITKDDQYVPTTRRNVVKAEGSDFCFSILPVPMCEDNALPTVTETMKMSFHCLPRRDMTAKKLLTESKRRVLGEIASRSIDFEERIEVAKMC